MCFPKYISLSLSLTNTHKYAVHKVRCRATAYKKMVAVASDYMLRTLFTAWLEDYKVTRRARRWFREQGGGEGEDSEEEKEWCWPEGDDPISSLPRNIAVKVDTTHHLLFGHMHSDYSRYSQC